MTSNATKIQELRDQIKALEEREREERAARIKAVKKQWHFTFRKMEEKSFDRLRPGCGLAYYYLNGEVLNIAECREAGMSDHDIRPGGMRYTVNLLNGRICCHGGGGNIYIPEGEFFLGNAQKRQEELEDAERVFAALEEAIKNGVTEVTDIITSQRHFGW